MKEMAREKHYICIRLITKTLIASSTLAIPAINWKLNELLLLTEKIPILFYQNLHIRNRNKILDKKKGKNNNDSIRIHHSDSDIEIYSLQI